LERENVNLEQRVLTIPRSKHGEVRHVRLNTAALAAFKSLLPNTEKGRATKNGQPGTQEAQPDPRVFVGERGALQGSRHWFDKAVKEAGVRDFTWHCLRHTFASRLVMQGVGLPEVMDLMGHKSIQVTMRYAHLAPAHQLAAVEKLAAYPA
jgi:integrase